MKIPFPSRGLLLPVALALAISTTAVAQAAQGPVDAAPNPELQQQLQAAQARLEAAAKEVAELAAKAGPGGPRIQLRIRRPGGSEQRDIEVTTQGPGGMAGPGGPRGMGGMGGMGGMEGPGVMGGMDPMQHRPHMREMRGGMGPMAGLRLAPLSPRLAGYFGAKAGVLVIKADSPALKLEDGDVITAIGGRTPTSPSHALRIFRSYEPGEKLVLQVMRDRKAQSIEVTVPPRAEVRRIELRRGGEPPAGPMGGPMGGPQGGPPAPPHAH